MKYHAYEISMRHDNGIIRIKTASTSLAEAITRILIAERAPLSAIKHAKRIKQVY
jgi:hypothetical protein